MYCSKDKNKYSFPEKQQQLAKYCERKGVRISSKCCDLSKKSPFIKYVKTIGADLKVSGERQIEGGVRARKHKDCFEHGKIDKYMPLWFWNNETKEYYKSHEGIVYSDCYEIWGMERTGCVGCPFNSKIGRDLDKIKEYEPNMYNACMKFFGEAYKLMDEFGIHREKILKGDDN